MRNECGEAVGAASREAFLLAKSPSLRALPPKLASEFDEDPDAVPNTLPCWQRSVAFARWHARFAGPQKPFWWYLYIGCSADQFVASRVVRRAEKCQMCFVRSRCEHGQMRREPVERQPGLK